MRKIIVLEHISLDGVVQAPGAKNEDPSGSFVYGGWISPYSDPVLTEALKGQMNKPFDLLLGRKTFEIWETYWPQNVNLWPEVNSATKYVASNSRTASQWDPSVFLGENLPQKISEIKKQNGLDLHVWGSANLIQTLIRHDLVDVFWLMIYPITLGHGKRLFAEGTVPTAFTVSQSAITPKGVIVVRYERNNNTP